ncbi:Disease resistance protein RGA2 [Hordeum vulgare]|nr:Disease resistance protein RGA2 [Hordeum vulgare]
MEVAIVERACTKLRAIVSETTPGLQEMLEALEAMQPALEDAKRESVDEEAGRAWLRRLRTAAHDISHMVDEQKACTAALYLIAYFVAPNSSVIFMRSV